VLVAVVAMGCAAASGLGVPYRVAHLGQGRPQYADEVGFLGEAGGRSIVLKWGFRDDADEREHLQVELWAGEPASGEAEPLAGFVLPDGFPQPELLGAARCRRGRDGRSSPEASSTSPLTTGSPAASCGRCRWRRDGAGCGQGLSAERKRFTKEVESSAGAVTLG
jgi:hypothetical protein